MGDHDDSDADDAPEEDTGESSPAQFAAPGTTRTRTPKKNASPAPPKNPSPSRCEGTSSGQLAHPLAALEEEALMVRRRNLRAAQASRGISPFGATPTRADGPAEAPETIAATAARDATATAASTPAPAPNRAAAGTHLQASPEGSPNSTPQVADDEAQGAFEQARPLLGSSAPNPLPVLMAPWTPPAVENFA